MSESVYSVRMASRRELKEVAIGVKLPERFSVPLPILRGRSHDVISQAVVHVAVVEGDTKWEGVKFDPPLSSAELAAIEWNEVMFQTLVRKLAVEMVADAGDAVPIDRVVVVADELTSRRNRRLTPDFLRDVARWWKEGGSARVAEQANVTRRQADRYVSSARDKGLL